VFALVDCGAAECGVAELHLGTSGLMAIDLVSMMGPGCMGVRGLLSGELSDFVAGCQSLILSAAGAELELVRPISKSSPNNGHMSVARPVIEDTSTMARPVWMLFNELPLCNAFGVLSKHEHHPPARNLDTDTALEATEDQIHRDSRDWTIWRDHTP
jgi:hypothetical protein